MSLNLILLSLLSCILGVAGKCADLLNEHGLKEPFKGARLLSRSIWGCAGMEILRLSPFAGLTYVVHVLYWFWCVKLEYCNHTIAGVLIVLPAFLFQGQFLQEHR